MTRFAHMDDDDIEAELVLSQEIEDAFVGILQRLVKQPDGSWVLPAKYEIEVNDAKRLVGLV